MAKPVDWNKVSMLTPGMKNLGNQINKRWPNRDGTSDGAVGNYEHTLEDSDHNPDDTGEHNAAWDSDPDNKSEVRAIDVDNDLGEPGMDMQDVIDYLRTLPNLGSVLRYMIYDRKMYHVDNNFKPTTYTGSSPHREHAHFSGAWTQLADENTTFNYKLDEVNMPTVKEIWNYQLEDPYDTANPKRKVTAGGWLRYTPSRSKVEEAISVGRANATALEMIASKVDLDPTELQQIKDTLAVPTAEENAQAVLAELTRGDMATLANVLRNALSPDDLEALKAEL
jgi:hypothetical protein